MWPNRNGAQQLSQGEWTWCTSVVSRPKRRFDVGQTAMNPRWVVVKQQLTQFEWGLTDSDPKSVELNSCQSILSGSLTGGYPKWAELMLVKQRWTQFELISTASSWPLTTLWLTDELSQLVPGYKHASLDRLVGCPGTIVVYRKHVAVLFSKTTVKRLEAVQIKVCFWTPVMLCTLLVYLGGAIHLLEGKANNGWWGRHVRKRTQRMYSPVDDNEKMIN